MKKVLFILAILISNVASSQYMGSLYYDAEFLSLKIGNAEKNKYNLSAPYRLGVFYYADSTFRFEFNVEMENYYTSTTLEIYDLPKKIEITITENDIENLLLISKRFDSYADNKEIVKDKIVLGNINGMSFYYINNKKVVGNLIIRISDKLYWINENILPFMVKALTTNRNNVVAEHEKKIEHNIVKPESEISVFPHSMKIHYLDDSTKVGISFSETWTKGGEIVKEKSYYSDKYYLSNDSLAKFISVIKELKEKGDKLKENNVSTSFEKYVGNVCGFEIEFHYDYEASASLYGSEEYSYHMMFKNINKHFFEKPKFEFNFELFNLKYADSLIYALTTGKDLYYAQLKAYTNKAKKDAEIVNKIF